MIIDLNSPEFVEILAQWHSSQNPMSKSWSKKNEKEKDHDRKYARQAIRYLEKKLNG